MFECDVTQQNHAALLTAAAHLDMTHVWKGLTFGKMFQTELSPDSVQLLLLQTESCMHFMIRPTFKVLPCGCKHT